MNATKKPLKIETHEIWLEAENIHKSYTENSGYIVNKHC